MTRGWRACGVTLAALALAACSSSGASGTAATAAVSTTQATTTTLPGITLPDSQAIVELVDQWRASYDAPGAVVALRVGDDPAVIVASGVDAKTSAPLDAHVPFPIASITKTFTAALALQLVDEGKLSLDDLVSEYVPDFPNAGRITVRELLTHTSGLPPEGDDSGGGSPYADAFQQLVLANLAKDFTPQEVLDFVKDRPLDFEPGTGVGYSNINTILLGQIVVAVTGTDLTTAFHRRLIDPLGLTHTYYGATEVGKRATPGLFRLDREGPVLNSADFPSRGLLSAIGPAGGMVSNVDDLLVFADRFLRDGAQGHVDLAQSRFQVTPKGTGLGVHGWGLGVGPCIFGGGCPGGTEVLGVAAAGSIPGANSVVAYFPAWDLTIVALANSSLADVSTDLTQQLLVAAALPVG